MGPINPDGWWCPYHGYCTPASLFRGADKHCGYGAGSALCIAQVYKLSPSDIEGFVKYWQSELNLGRFRPGEDSEVDLPAIVGEAIAEAALSQTIDALRENDV